jgi:hypothetical protein
VKRCKFCGHTGRLTPIHNQWVKRIDDYRCAKVGACNDRVRVLGKWVGKRVLRRTDRDGTEWVIRQATGVSRRWVLTMTYRDQRLSSMHESPDEAKAHADDLINSMTARDIDAYRDEPAPSDEQMELL